MKKSLFISGGWAGHHPEQISQIFAEEMDKHGLAPRMETSLDILADAGALREFALIFPCWTMGSLTPEQAAGLQAAVRSGVGLGGIHGGMGDAFRGNLDYEWMVGGHFVGHPHVGDYVVTIRDSESPVTKGLPGSFAYRSEQYYMLIDPAVQVLADAPYLYEGRESMMPVAWTRQWGQGRVFYSALGHEPEEFSRHPEARKLTVQGMLWAGNAL